MRSIMPIRRAIVAILGLVAAVPLAAMYVTPDIENVPVDRLIKNLEAAAAKTPNNAAGWRLLARTHALAYAQKSATIPVRRGNEAAGPWFGIEPAHVPFRPKPTDDDAARRAAAAHLAKAIEHYSQALRLAPDDLVTQLGYAWTLDQSGEKAKAIAAYRTVIDAAWKQEQNMTRAGLGWHSITAEAAGYLIPLLDRQHRGDQHAPESYPADEQSPAADHSARRPADGVGLRARDDRRSGQRRCVRRRRVRAGPVVDVDLARRRMARSRPEAVREDRVGAAALRQRDVLAVLGERLRRARRAGR